MSRRFAKLLLVLLAAIALPAHAAGPVLHTYFDPDPAEDLALHATTADGKLPAAIETPSGVAQAPDPLRAPRNNEQTYGGSSTPSTIDATYRIDRNTSRPDLVSYDDPFIPAVTPFKRLFAYDVVEQSLELGVADKALVKLNVGGSVRSGDDQFYADMNVDLVAETAVRIPSVGPGTRVLSAHTNPPVSFQLQRDGAENWFIRSSESRRVRLVLQLAIGRETFGSPFAADASYASLSRFLPRMPQVIKAAGERVLEKIGISRAMTPAAAVGALVGHFRSFAPSDDRPLSSGAALYEELKKLLDGGVIYHCGPVVKKHEDGHYSFVAAGPTTSIREEPYQADVIRHFNVKGVIGKGGMGASTLKACQEQPAVYLHAIGGAATLIAQSVKEVVTVHKLEFGVPEAMWVIRVEDFPVVVTMDSHGQSIHDLVQADSRQKLAGLIGV